MSIYDGPDAILPIYNPSNYFYDVGVGITQGEGDLRYIKKAGDTATGLINFANGLVSAAGSAPTPQGISFISDSNTGIYSVGADQLGFSTGGTNRLTISTTTTTSQLPIQVPSTTSITNCGLQVGLANTGLQYNAGILYFGLGGTQMMRYQAAQIYSSTAHNFTNGSAAAPAICAASYQTTGLYWAAGPILNISTGGTQRCNFSSTSVQLNGVPLDCNAQNVRNAPQIGNEAGNLELRMNSTGAGGTLTLTGGTGLLSGSAGGNSGQHLVLTINGVNYKIALLNV